MADANGAAGERPLIRDPNLHVIFSVTLIAIMGVSSITPAFPKVVDVLGISPQQVGLLITVFTLPGVVLTPILGVLADRFGRTRILVPSLLLFAVAGTACAFARDFTLLLLLRFFQGFGGAALGSLNVTIIGDLYEGGERPTAMGYNASVLSIGTASYPVLGGALATLAWYYPFALPLLAIPTALLVRFRLNNPEPTQRQRMSDYLSQAWHSIRNRKVIGLFAISIITFVILYGSYLTYFPLLIDQRFGGSALVIGLLMASMSLSTALTSSQLGRLTHRFSPPKLLTTAYVLYAVAMAIIPFLPLLWTLLFATVVFGVGQGLNIPTVQTLLAELAPMKQRAAVMSVNGMVLRLGQTLGPLVIGGIYTIWGLDGAFFVGAALGASMLLVVWLLFHK